MKKSVVAASFAIAALTLTGCAEATGDTSGKAGTNASVAPEKASDEKNDGTLKFGQTVNYDDGFAITISKPQPFQPSEYAAFDKAPAYLKFKVTLVNGTKETFDPSLVYITLQSGDSEAAQIFDHEKKIGEVPQTKILAGRQATYWVGFGVQNKADLVLEVSDPLAHDAQIFTNVA